MMLPQQGKLLKMRLAAFLDFADLLDTGVRA